MMLRLLMILLLASVSPTPCTDAGEIIGFKAGPQTGTYVVLSHVARKALVAEFLDPDDTGVGKSISYLVWREMLTAISDQAGAGVILARAPGNERITEMLEQAYHEAAIRLAKGQEAGMAVWGAVNAAGDNLYVSTYLSLLPETADVPLTLGLFGQPPLAPGLQAEITRTNYNFPPVETTRAQLFDRRIVTRAAVTLRATDDPSARAVAKVPLPAFGAAHPEKAADGLGAKTLSRVVACVQEEESMARQMPRLGVGEICIPDELELIDG